MTATSTLMHDPEIKSTSNPWKRFFRSSTPYLLIGPFFLGFLIFQLLPILFSIYLSLAEWNGMKAISFVGIENFATLVGDAKFWNAFQNTLIITIVCSIVGTAGSLGLAVFLEKVPDRFASVLRVVFFLPSVTSVVVITYVWKQLYNADSGFINLVLTEMGLSPVGWLTETGTAMISLLIMLIWAGLGWDALIITAGLRSIPDEIYDASKVDGANGWSEFLYITFPLLRPTLTFVLVTSVIYLWGLFAQPQLLTGGGPVRSTQTIALYLYDMGFRYHKFGYASAIAMALSVLMFVTSYINYKVMKSDVRY